MKFQNPILKCVRTDGRTYKPKAICPFNFFNVGGIINELVSMFVWLWIYAPVNSYGHVRPSVNLLNYTISWAHFTSKLFG